MAEKRKPAPKRIPAPKRKSALPRTTIKNAGESNVGALFLGMQSYYVFCLEQALENVKQARMLMAGDVVDENHELPRIERLLEEAIEAS
jgi:hypothetical protein